MAMKSHPGGCRTGPGKISMRPLLALVALWATLDACLAEDSDSRHGANSSIAHAAELASEKLKEAFSRELCQATVKKVQETGKYTEESIVPICNDILKSPKCDFFAEALSLASSHSDFDSKKFCLNMDEAHFCADVMDKLLMSTPVSDLAFGECERAQKTPDESRCRKMKQMLSYAVQNEDLDTLRACYMLEAFTNMTTSQELKDNNASTSARIIASSSKELEDAGKGRNIEYKMSQPDIVLQPQPLDPMGKGKGNMTLKNLSAAPADAALAGATQAGGIIVEPIPVGSTVPIGQQTGAPGAAAPAAAAPAAAAAATNIIAPPQPVAAAVVTGTAVTRTASAAPQAPGVVSLHAPRTAAHPALAKLPPAEVAGKADQSLLPHITAVQLANSTATARPAAAKASRSSPTLKQVPATHPKLPQLLAHEKHNSTVVSPNAGASNSTAQPASRAALPGAGERLALHAVSHPTAKPRAVVPVANSRPAPTATAQAASRTVANATSRGQEASAQAQARSQNRTASQVATSAVLRRRTGLAQARLVAEVHNSGQGQRAQAKAHVSQSTSTHHKEEARKEAKDYNGFLSKFVA